MRHIEKGRFMPSSHTHTHTRLRSHNLLGVIFCGIYVLCIPHYSQLPCTHLLHYHFMVSSIIYSRAIRFHDLWMRQLRSCSCRLQQLASFVAIHKLRDFNDFAIETFRELSLKNIWIVIVLIYSIHKSVQVFIG